MYERKWILLIWVFPETNFCGFKRADSVSHVLYVLQIDQYKPCPNVNNVRFVFTMLLKFENKYGL